MSKLVLEVLSEWVISQPDKKVWTFLDDKGEISDCYSYQVFENEIHINRKGSLYCQHYSSFQGIVMETSITMTEIKSAIIEKTIILIIIMTKLTTSFQIQK